MDGTVRISELPLAEAVRDADLIVIEQDGTAKKLEGVSLTRFIDRNVIDIAVSSLEYGVKPTVEYDKVTGKLKLGIPKGNSIVSISLNKNNQVVYRWADGSTVAMETIKGDTGKSAYQYAVEQGYTGSEIDFATLQLNLYQASLKEDERVKAEEKRKNDYAYMMQKLDDRLDDLDKIENRMDCTITGTTLVLNLIDTGVVDTTLML